ncbi:F0F1 ATP synthase subunit gamma [Sphingomonas sp. MMS24-J13]|uniref:F0F1 ATP synthase subunit gamma n=1 Tax=Sphingomonas sp. MMS24-J13 TaxID=3238686 RepID=UPI00384D7DAA
MTERLADVSQRIGTTRQLGAVVNAMRGIAGARAQQSRALLPAVRAFAEIAARAIGQARLLEAPGTAAASRTQATGKPGLLVFGAEQGFAGAFVEQVLDAAEAGFGDAHVFLVGTRSAVLAAQRQLAVDWHGELPSRASAIPDTATLIVDALYAYLGQAGAVPIAMVYPVWTVGRGVAVTRRALLPFDPKAFPVAAGTAGPLTNLPAADLIARLGQEYVFAQVCEAALEAFAAENEARMATMAAAKTNIDSKLTTLQALERRIRQEEVTAEVVELAAGARARN